MNDLRLLLLSERDNVLMVCQRIDAGETVLVGGQPYRISQAVALGHKLARGPIRAGDKVIKYGAPIGSATRDIAPAEHVHVHNLKSDYTKTHLIEKAGS